MILSKEPSLTDSVSNSEIEINNQDGVGETLPASSLQRTENKAGRMLSSENDCPQAPVQYEALETPSRIFQTNSTF